MPRDSAATQARILDAATVEFSTHGLAGARVDRIAARAEANKQLIYAYFQNKENLFDSTLETNIELLLDAVPFDATDLPGYVQALFDFGRNHPELVRLARWHSLERPGGFMQLPRAAESTKRKMEALAAAQANGAVDNTLAPDLLLELLLALAHAHPGLETPDLPIDAERGQAQRDALAFAVARLTTPTARPPSVVVAALD